MFCKNLKYYRLKKNLTQKILAVKVNVPEKEIAGYESGDLKPTMEMIKLLAKELDIRVSDFLAERKPDLTFKHGRIRIR